MFIIQHDLQQSSQCTILNVFLGILLIESFVNHHRNHVHSMLFQLILSKIHGILHSLTSELFNISLADQFKKAIIRPFLKKPHLDPEDYSNYRPVANLSFLSKILERIVANQLNNYFVQNDLFPSFQSAYRSNHSNETALLRVVNDI